MLVYIVSHISLKSAVPVVFKDLFTTNDIKGILFQCNIVWSHATIFQRFRSVTFHLYGFQFLFVDLA